MANWMGAVAKRMKEKGTKGALHEDMGIAKDKSIPSSRLRSEAAALHAKAEKGKLTDAERLRSQRINFALRARKQ